MSDNYTPIKDSITGLPIKLGDICKNEKGYVGVVSWDDYLNIYLLKSKNGGNLYSRTYTKVKSIHVGNVPDTSRIECRNKNTINKKKW